MKIWIFITVFFSIGAFNVNAQTRSELEEQRKKAMDEINYVDNILKTTEKEKTESLQSLRVLNNKLNLRESVLKGMSDEIELLSLRVDLYKTAVDMMEGDLVALKNDYEKSILNSYKLKKAYPDIVYIMSAKDFNQGYKRIKYLQQVTEYRRMESEIIKDLKRQIEETNEILESDLKSLSELRQKEEQQRNMIRGEQTREQKILRSLRNRENQLKKELEEKMKVIKRIEREIARVIEEERRKSAGGTLTPEQQLIGENFSDNKGRLPWPVDRGVITSHFGTHPHPVLKYVTEENIGIEITSEENTMARSVFNGEVSAISTIQGGNMTVIIKHGKYLSVYNNLVNVRVKKGDKVDTKQILGEIYKNPKENNNCTLNFMIFEDRNPQDPELWITKI